MAPMNARGFMPLFLILLLGTTSASVFAAAPDLDIELQSITQSGARIEINLSSDDKLQVSRSSTLPQTQAEELQQREEVFQIFKKVNFAKQIDLQGDLAAPNLIVENLLHQFALSDEGAIWLRRVTDETIDNINKGYLEYKLPKNKTKLKLSQLLTGETTEDAQFDLHFEIFKIYGRASKGAFASIGYIALSQFGIGHTFSSTGQSVDPMAILSHEFGHTKYGIPESSGSLEGEALVVEKFENPVRRKNGFEDRATYCDPATNLAIDIKTREIFPCPSTIN